MANLFDYLIWRGDLTLSQSPFNDVDSLVLSTLSYVFFDGIVAENMEERITIGEMVDKFLARPRAEWKFRVSDDERLLYALKEMHIVPIAALFLQQFGIACYCRQRCTQLVGNSIYRFLSGGYEYLILLHGLF